MKFLIVFALFAAVASANLIGPAPAAVAEIQEIIAAINSPNTDPATAVALQEMLAELIGGPISVGPAIIDNEHIPIDIGPAFVEEKPEDEHEPIPERPVVIASSPLVEIIIKVRPNSGIGPNPVVVEGLPENIPSPVHVVNQPEIDPSPVHVIEEAIESESVIIGELPDAIVPPVVGPITPTNVPMIEE